MYEVNEQILKDKILALLNEEQYKPMKKRKIAVLMEVPTEETKIFKQFIDKLARDGEVIVTKKGKVMLPESLNLIKGVFTANVRGFGFVIPEVSDGNDIFIAGRYMNGAMHKDEVLCKIICDKGEGRKVEGEIIQILKRGVKEIIGTYQKGKGFGFVVPDDKKMGQDIFISKKNSKDAADGQKVVVKIIKSGPDLKNNEGKIIDIIGFSSEPGVDISSILRQYNIPTEFGQEVLEELEDINDEVMAGESSGRTDYRDKLMVTIDGDDTKDVDDAVTLEVLDNGHYRLGVHIADVSHYVVEGSGLNDEAFKRGTSVYLVDRVIPMIPAKLSNGICSLNPNVDRLALSCVMEIDRKGIVVNHQINKSIINVKNKMTYNIVYDLLTNEESEYKELYGHLMPMLKQAETLCGILREKRIKRGAIEFDFPESKIIVDDKGVPIEIRPYTRNIATSIIEEFMLICNETVAEEYFWLGHPFVFRSHEEPDTEKMHQLADFVHNFGYVLKGNGTHPGSLQALLSKIESTPEETIISKVVLRSFKQARYTPENIGHYGLAAKYYCHFTSPIRRYPDLQIHRIIKEHISGGLTDERSSFLNHNMPEICKQCSVTERSAEAVERETDNLKKVEFMADKIGEQFEGVISGVTSWGIYIALENTVEGMVSLSNIKGDYFVFDKDRMMYIGERTKKTYRLGDKVLVEVTRANVEERNLDFVFV